MLLLFIYLLRGKVAKSSRAGFGEKSSRAGFKGWLVNHLMQRF